MSGSRYPYVKESRLADVMALIQVLALHAYRHRSDKGLTKTLNYTPSSATSWLELAKEHPEFFRVVPEVKLGISLHSTHVLPKDGEGKRKLPADFTALLLKTAIELHDRQMNRSQKWRALIPIGGAIILGIFALISAIINLVGIYLIYTNKVSYDFCKNSIYRFNGMAYCPHGKFMGSTQKS